VRELAAFPFAHCPPPPSQLGFSSLLDERVVLASPVRSQADESIAARKGRESRANAFSPPNRPFLRVTRRGHDRLLGSLQARAVMAGEGHAPVLAVLVAAAKKTADDSISGPKGRGPQTFSLFPCKIGASVGPSESVSAMHSSLGSFRAFGARARGAEPVARSVDGARPRWVCCSPRPSEPT
jgi:hypothetical protein